ncbi:hypothetical protein [Sinomonas atrocyanea]|uniref:hypothetical protein n=1 Tax=Sinomonas atrocyanea TaxID=37927 RepID=UPI003D97A758
MSLLTALGRLAPSGLPPMVFQEARFDRVGVRAADGALRLDVGLAALDLAPFGEFRATVRFTAVLERHLASGETVQRSVPCIQTDSSPYQRDRMGHASAALAFAPTPLPRLWARMGTQDGSGVTLVRAFWSDLMIMDPSHRLLQRIRGEWNHSAAVPGTRTTAASGFRAGAADRRRTG